VKSDPVFSDQAERRLGVVGLGRAVVFLDDTLRNVVARVDHRPLHHGEDWKGEVEVAAASQRSP